MNTMNTPMNTMNTKTTLKMVAAGVAAGLLAVGTVMAQQDTGADGTTAEPRANTGQLDAGGQAGGAGAKGAMSEQKKQSTQKFVAAAAAGNQLEIDLGKLMSESGDPEVKQIAERMVKDHTSANEKLQKAAEKDGLEFKSELDPAGKGTQEVIQQKQGADRDRAYIFSQTGGHQVVTLQYQHAIHAGCTPAVEQYAKQTLPIVKSHEKMFKSEAQKLAMGESASDSMESTGQPGAMPTGGSMPSSGGGQ